MHQTLYKMAFEQQIIKHRYAFHHFAFGEICDWLYAVLKLFYDKVQDIFLQFQMCVLHFKDWYIKQNNTLIKCTKMWYFLFSKIHFHQNVLVSSYKHFHLTILKITTQDLLNRLFHFSFFWPFINFSFYLFLPMFSDQILITKYSTTVICSNGYWLQNGRQYFLHAHNACKIILLCSLKKPQVPTLDFQLLHI